MTKFIKYSPVLFVLLFLILTLWKHEVRMVLAGDIAEEKPYTYHLVSGWSFISFPMRPVSFSTADQLMDYVEQEGGYLLGVSRWDGDRWQEYIAVGDNRYGTDFDLVPGEAYFISSASDITLSILGITMVSSPEIILTQGWNAVGLSPSQFNRAQQVLDGTYRDGVEKATEIDRWYSGNWQMLVKRWYSPTNIQEYGDDFAIASQSGYMIRANQLVRLTL